LLSAPDVLPAYTNQHTPSLVAATKAGKDDDGGSINRYTLRLQQLDNFG